MVRLDTLIKAFARKDNEGLSYLDKSKDWKEFLGKGEMFYNRMQDDVYLTQNDPCYWLGATVWGERESFPNVVCEIVKGYNPEKHELLFSDRSFRKYCRYFIENIPILLDSPNEWYYDKNKHRLYVRLKDDRNPNDSIIEAAKYYIFLDIDGKEHIMVDGLKIRFLILLIMLMNNFPNNMLL